MVKVNVFNVLLLKLSKKLTLTVYVPLASLDGLVTIAKLTESSSNIVDWFTLAEILSNFLINFLDSLKYF